MKAIEQQNKKWMLFAWFFVCSALDWKSPFFCFACFYL
jgi:hypothetical protein